MFNCIVNHSTYRRGLTLKGNTACRKRNIARICFEIKFTMNRFTNPRYNFEVESQVSLLNKVWSSKNYVVFLEQEYMKQPVLGKDYSKGSSKVNIWLKISELGIFRNMKVWGKRRTHSTILMNRKGSSLARMSNPWLLGQEENIQLINLKNNVLKRIPELNFSGIMADKYFLIACWFVIKSKPENLTSAFDNTMDEINTKWFEEMAKGMRNGSFKFSIYRNIFIPKSNNKTKLFIISSLRDKIVQEGIKILLESAYDKKFSSQSFGFRPNSGHLIALNDINTKCKEVTWYIKGNIEQFFPTIDHNILINIISKEIKDQAFIDLLYKYLRSPYGENPKHLHKLKVGLIKENIISPILGNIYLDTFDQWVEKSLTICFTKGVRKKSNQEYWKQYYKIDRKVVDKSIKSTFENESSWKRMYYFRYADNFIIGVEGSKADCIFLREKIFVFLKEKLKLNLSLEKTKIIHAESSPTRFLGYKIRKTSIKKISINKDSEGHMVRRVPRLLLEAPIKEILLILKQKGYIRNGNPTRNGKLIKLELYMIIEHYKTLESGIFNYYALATNYERLVSSVHYFLKFSCVLTIASKMRLKTMKQVFSKYGKLLSMQKPNGKLIQYNTPSYKRPTIYNFFNSFENIDSIIDKIHNKVIRKNLKRN